MRLGGALDYDKIVDGHRRRRVPNTFASVGHALQTVAQIYRRDRWMRQPCAVEVWCEKDALTEIILPVCTANGVPYVVTRGFPSETLIHAAARAMVAQAKTTRLFYFGDHDASGRSIDARLETDLRAHGADVTVTRVALTAGQVEAYGLPTRPGKRTDSRHSAFAATYGEESVELDALPPNVLMEFVTASIAGVIDWALWEDDAWREEQDRRELAELAQASADGEGDEGDEGDEDD
jgi:hypothetical protein